MILRNLFMYCFLVVFAFGQAQSDALKRADKKFERLSYVDARKMYLDVASQGHASADLFQKIGDTYYFNANYEKAKEWYDRLAKEFPDEIQPEYYFRYAQTLRALKLYDEADKAMNTFYSINGEDSRAELFVGNRDYVFEAKNNREYTYELENVRKVNSRYSDFAPTIYEGKLIFASARDTGGFTKNIHKWNNQPFLDLYQSSASDELSNFGAVSSFNKKLNTKFHESTTCFTKDGKTIYFTRNNFTKGKYRKDKNGTNKLKIYKATKRGNGWSEAEELPFNSDQFNTAHPTLSPDGKKLYFASDRKGSFGFSDIWVVDILENGTYSEPANLGRPVNTEGRETFPFMSENGKLFYASNGHPGLGGLDVYRTEPGSEPNSKWLNPVNIGEPVNSSYDDFTFIVSDSLDAGFLASNRKKGLGGDDIYRFKRTLVPLECEVTISGVVKDVNTGQIIPEATVQLLDLDNKVIKEIIAGKDAKFVFEEPECENKYIVRASKEEYSQDEKVVIIPKKGIELELKLELGLERVLIAVKQGDDLAKSLRLNPIYYDFDKSNIRPDAALELAKVISVMKEYPTMIIDSRSHTDSRGSDSYNLSLSDRRAKSAVAYIIAHGIEASRISGDGYGETQLVNGCDRGNDSDCTEEEHQLNRRTEFIIISM